MNQSRQSGPRVGGDRLLMTGDKRPDAATGQFLGRVDMAAFERISRLCKFTSPRTCTGWIYERFVYPMVRIIIVGRDCARDSATSRTWIEERGFPERHWASQFHHACRYGSMPRPVCGFVHIGREAHFAGDADSLHCLGCSAADVHACLAF